jgi:hypothetical protein
MRDDIRELTTDIRKLGNLSDAIQQAFWQGHQTGFDSREYEIRHLYRTLDEVMQERNVLLQRLEPDFAWRSWLERNPDQRQGYPFIDLMGGAR